MFVTYYGNNYYGNIREAAIAVQSAQTAMFLYYYFSLYHYYFNYFCNYRIYSHYSKTSFSIWVGIHCRNQANCIIHLGGSVFVAANSSMDSIGEHQHVISLSMAGTGRGVFWVVTTDV
jgi:hypothetical protein